MLISLFNVFLIIAITYVTYKYFALRDKVHPGGDRSSGYLTGIGAIVDKLEGYDSPHSAEMAEMAEKIAIEKGLKEEEIEAIKFATLLHDIGELLLPRNLLKSSEKLDGEKQFLMRTHPLLGELELKNKNYPFDEVPAIVRWHHERWDGSGYPDNLKGEEIPLSARILSLVDAVSAMKSDRPYRKRVLKIGEIVKELDRMSGLQFDPELVEVWKMIYLPVREEKHD